MVESRNRSVFLPARKRGHWASENGLYRRDIALRWRPARSRRSRTGLAGQVLGLLVVVRRRKMSTSCHPRRCPSSPAARSRPALLAWAFASCSRAARGSAWSRRARATGAAARPHSRGRQVSGQRQDHVHRPGERQHGVLSRGPQLAGVCDRRRRPQPRSAHRAGPVNRDRERRGRLGQQQRRSNTTRQTLTRSSPRRSLKLANPARAEHSRVSARCSSTPLSKLFGC